MEAESKKFIEFLSRIYAELGFDKWRIKLSTRPEKRVGSDEIWDKMEAALANAVTAAGHPYEIFPGEGAFYAPKLEFVLTDAIGRDWQCGTLQLDPNLPERLDATYIGEDGAKHRPFMLHRACLGSVEEVVTALTLAGVRAEADMRNEKINYKVREHSVGKVPVILAIGNREVEERSVSVRRLGETRVETMTLEQAVAEFGKLALPPDLA